MKLMDQAIAAEGQFMASVVIQTSPVPFLRHVLCVFVYAAPLILAKTANDQVDEAKEADKQPEAS
jgi:hypothetical protein